VVNLGSIQSLDRLSLDFLQNLGAGIAFPDSVTYYASDDDVNWYPLGKVWSSQGGGSYTPQSQSYELNTNVNAQYVRAQFNTKVWAFIDQFSVFGNGQQEPSSHPVMSYGPAMTEIMGNDYLVDPSVDALPPNTVPLSTVLGGLMTGPGTGAPGQAGPGGSLQVPPSVSPPGPPTPSGYLRPQDPGSGGISNMQLVYTDGYGSLGTWTESDFTPMIASENGSGQPTGWMFDASLFSPYSVTTSVYGWSSWVDNLFSPTIDLSALNQSVGSLKQELQDPGFTESVVITIPGLSSDPSNFGATDSVNSTLNLDPAQVGATTALENKAKAVDWYVQKVLSMWQDAHLNNLRLAGFYWQPESVNEADPNDAELIEATSAIVHDAGMTLFWIPFYGAIDVPQWRQLGFDNVTIQPHVAFDWSINAQARLESTADQAMYYHTGLEMEQHWDVMSDVTPLAQIAQNRYFDYFTGGNVYGYEYDVSKTWYLNSKTLLTAYQDPNPFYHQVYDNSVLFVDGQWKNTIFQ